MVEEQKRRIKESFVEYRRDRKLTTNDIAQKLGLSGSTIKKYFTKFFGDEYNKIAAKKQDLIELDKKGGIFEELALEYFKLLGENVEDVRRRCIIKGSLKRSDFIIGNIFVEVKCTYIQLFGFGNMKGYKEILSDYLGKQIKSNKIISKGIIVSLSGFSKSVKKQAKKDGIKLIGYKELKGVFEKNKRADLVLKLEKLKPWTSQLRLANFSLALIQFSESCYSIWLRFFTCSLA